MKTTNNISILIPCLNEERTIRSVVMNAKKYAKKYLKHGYEIIVSDNGSTDNTLRIIKSIKGIKIVNVPVKGYGAALHWGIINAKGRYILFGDADMSYPFSNLSKFMSVIGNKPDLVLGTRLKGKIQKGAMPFLHQFLGTPVLTLLIRLIYKIPTTDCNSGMRMIKKTFYKKLNMKCSGMEWASELLIKTAIKHGNYVEVPIRFLKDKRDRKAHLSTWSDGWRHLKSIVLLKPESLYILPPILLILSIYYYEINFALTFLFADLFIVLVLSLLTLNLLSAIIENKKSKVSDFLLKFKLVPVTGLISLIVAVLIIVIPDYRLGTKLFLTSILGIIFMWIFLVETIKTHLANKLPE